MIDLRSDTVTQPTDEMRLAMMNAIVGDDVYGDDPTINKLQGIAAEMMGKEAALFVPTGTMGNQIAIMTHTHYGDEIICGKNSHIVHYEAGAPARLSGVSYAIVDHPSLWICADDVKNNIRGIDDHFPATGLLCLENALTNGDVVPLEILQGAYQTAQQAGIPVHLDGARIFNAALALGVDVKEIASCGDSVMFCISKGLCAPVGSLVCGSKAFIDKARKNRKIVGGGMRQAGVLAACGIVALEKMIPILQKDHENAKYLAKRLTEIPDVFCDTERVKINMVFWKTNIAGFNSSSFVEFMRHKDITLYGILGDEYRWVTHHGINRSNLDYCIDCLEEYIQSLH